MAVAYVKGIRAGGMLSTAKHFPGHGDTATDTHLDLALVENSRSALDEVELPPFKAAIAAGVDAVMSSHIRLPALDPTRGPAGDAQPPDPHRPAAPELGFDGLVFTDSMSMHAISERFAPGAGGRAGGRGGGRRRARPARPRGRYARASATRWTGGEIPLAQLERSVERILRAKARLGLDRSRDGGRRGGAVRASAAGARAALAEEIAARALTLIKDERAAACR